MKDKICTNNNDSLEVRENLVTNTAEHQSLGEFKKECINAECASLVKLNSPHPF